MTRARVRAGLRVMAVALAAASAAACGSSAGPVRTFTDGGRPVLDVNSVVVSPGQSADAEAYVVNSARDPVHVTGVSAVAVPGKPEARLVHTGIQSTGGSVAAMRGWPAVPVRPLVGARLPHGHAGIVFGITGPAVGHAYAVAGLRIEYRYRGQSYSVIAWSGAVACVAATSQSSSPGCGPFYNAVSGIVKKMAGVSSS